MKEEYSVSKETLVNLEGGLPQSQHYEEPKGKRPMASSGWKEVFRIASFILYVQLILFVGWASYTIWDNYRHRPVEATVRSHLVIHAAASPSPPLPPPAASYSPGDDSLDARETAMNNEELLKVTEAEALDDIVENLWSVLLAGRAASLFPPQQKEAGAAGRILEGNDPVETIPREKVAVELNKSDEISTGREEEEEEERRRNGVKKLRVFPDSSEYDEDDKVEAWYKRKNINDWSVGSFLWPTLLFEDSAEEDSEAGMSPVQSSEQASERSDAVLADESGFRDSPQTNRLFVEADKSERAGQAEENSTSSDRQQEQQQQQQQQQQFNRESNIPIFQGYRKYKCAYHIEGGLKCKIVEPSVDTNRESSEWSKSKKYLDKKQALEEEVSDIFGGADVTHDFDEEIFEDWSLLLGLNQHFPNDQNIGGHDAGEGIESGGKLGESSVETWPEEDDQTHGMQPDSQANGEKLGHENPEGQLVAARGPEMNLAPPEENEENEGAQQQDYLLKDILSTESDSQ